MNYNYCSDVVVPKIAAWNRRRVLFYAVMAFGTINLFTKFSNVPGSATTTSSKTNPNHNPNHNHNHNPPKPYYADWRELAVDLAGRLPEETLRILHEDDPFGVRTFEQAVRDSESVMKRPVKTHELEYFFPCPSERIGLPDQRNYGHARAFRKSNHNHNNNHNMHQQQQYIYTNSTNNNNNGNNGTNNNVNNNNNGNDPYSFVFFQHLRKAGGTNFCTLAEANLERHQVPKPFCMPDYMWGGKNTIGYLGYYTNDEIVTKMHEKGHKIAGNEFDPFVHRFFDFGQNHQNQHQHHIDANNASVSTNTNTSTSTNTTASASASVVLVTSFRRPIDRALSEFRFECIEDRSCHIKNVTEWWDVQESATRLTNYYTRIFAGEVASLRNVSIGTSADDALERQRLLGTALDTIARFNLVTVMEWLTHAPDHVTNVLGFAKTGGLTKKVLPLAFLAKRDAQNDTESWTPERHLPPSTHRRMSLDLALDEILTDAARRIFLERVVCSDVRGFD